MIESTPNPQPKLQPTPEPASIRWRTIILFVFSLIATLVLAGRGIYLLIIGLTDSSPSAAGLRMTDIYGAISMFFCAFLLLPILILSLRRLRGLAIGKARVPPIKLWQVILLLVVWIIAIVLSSFLSNLSGLGWILATPFFLLGIAVPVAGLVWVAIGGIHTASWRRLWASLGLGMTLSTSIAIGLELLSVGVGLVIVGIVAAIDPVLGSTIQQLRDQLTHANNVQDLLPILTPYLNNPLLLLIVLLFVSGIGPLIEEAFKPLAVWLVGKQLHSPAEGFALGALCGAGFAILEGMLVSSGATDMVGISVAARATSSLMHITASSFMGWAIASAILEKKYFRLLFTYIVSVGIHGLWNAAVVLTVYGGLRLTNAGSPLDILGGISATLGIALLGVLVVGILVALPLINRRLRSTNQVSNDIIAQYIS